MATFVSDSFTDTSGTALSSHTGETGATWVKHASYSTTLVISNANRVRTDGTASTITYYASGTPASADYKVGMTLRQLTGAGHLGVAGRINTAANTMYRARYDGGANQFHLQSAVAGTFVLLGTFNHDMIDAEERLLELVMDGDQISLQFDGVAQVGPLTNTAITAAGLAGAYGFSTGSDTTGIHGDNFFAEDIASGGATVAVTGLEVPIAFGTPTSDTTVTVGVTGLAVPVGFGDPTAAATVTVAVDGLEVPVAFGDVTVVQDNVPQTVPVDGLAVPVQFGTPTVTVDQVVPVTGLEVPIQFGTVSVVANQTITVTGLEIAILFGAASPLITGWTPVAENDSTWTPASAAGGIWT